MKNLKKSKRINLEKCDKNKIPVYWYLKLEIENTFELVVFENIQFFLDNSKEPKYNGIYI